MLLRKTTGKGVGKGQDRPHWLSDIWTETRRDDRGSLVDLWGEKLINWDLITPLRYWRSPKTILIRLFSTAPFPGTYLETIPALSQNKIMRIWGGKFSLGRYFSISPEVRIFLQISWQCFFFLLFGSIEATADENQCKTRLRRYRSHIRQRTLKGRGAQRL